MVKKTILIVISLIGLLFTILPSFLYFFEFISFDSHKNIMLAGAFAWFGTAIFWIRKKESSNQKNNS